MVGRVETAEGEGQGGGNIQEECATARFRRPSVISICLRSQLVFLLLASIDFALPINHENLSDNNNRYSINCANHSPSFTGALS